MPLRGVPSLTPCTFLLPSLYKFQQECGPAISQINQLSWQNGNSTQTNETKHHFFSQISLLRDHYC